MKSWTVAEMVEECPCYSRERIEQLAGGRERLTLLEILDLDISDQDKAWVCARGHEYRAEWIERVVTRAVETRALRCGVPVVEQWAARWLSGEDRSHAAAHAAACAAACAYADAYACAAYAAYATYTDAAYDAAANAAHAAAHAAANAVNAAYAAEWARQVQDMRDVIAEQAEKGR